MRRILSSIFFSFAIVFSAIGQAADQDMKALINQIGDEISLDTANGIDFIAVPPEVERDSALQAKYFESITAYYDYRVNGFRHRHSVFQWQLYSSKVVFIAVLVLLLAGIVFSGIQFWKGLKDKQLEATSLEALPTGIKVSSPVLGVIVLIISLLFFYLYLVYIFPVQETF